MLSKAEIKRIKSLKEKKFRDEYSQFVVEGEKMVQEALSSSFKVVAVYREEEIGAENMAKISQLSSPSPVLAVVEKPAPKGTALERGLYLGLDSVRDPTGSASAPSSPLWTAWKCTIPKSSRLLWAPCSG